MNRSVKEDVILDQSAAHQVVLAHLISGNSCFYLGSFLRNYIFLTENIGCKRNRDLSAPNLTQLGWVRSESCREGAKIKNTDKE